MDWPWNEEETPDIPTWTQLRVNKRLAQFIYEVIKNQCFNWKVTHVTMSRKKADLLL